MDITTISIWVGVVILAIIWAAGSFVTTQQQEIKIIERFGKYSKTLSAGLSTKRPFIESVAGTLNLKLQQADVIVQAKTSDNVFVGIKLSVQYQVIAESAVDAFYKLQNPVSQIESFVFNIVRSEVPKITLQDLFANQDHIAEAVDSQLEVVMKTFGYQIYRVLVVQVAPDNSIVVAMNNVKASEQNKVAAANNAEAQKITTVKAAEAEAETKRLNGEGIAAERQAIVDGLKKSVDELAEATGTTAQEAMSILMTTQYYDTLKAIGASSKNTIMIPYGVSGADQVREAIIAASKV